MLRKNALPLVILFMTTTANAGGYVGVGIGQSSVDLDAIDFGPGVSSSISDTDTSVKIVGGYEINENFSVEAGYTNFGEFGVDYTDGFDSLSENYEATALYLAAVGSIPLGQASLFGKFGLASWDLDASISSTFGVSASASASGTDPVYGFGAQLDVSNNVMLRVEFERYTNVGDENETGESDIDLLSVSAAMRF